MTRKEKDFASFLWFFAKVAALILLSGCAGAKTALEDRAQAQRAADCIQQGNALIDSALTCQQAVAALAELVRGSPDCARIFGDGGAIRLVCDPPDGGRE